MLKLSNRAQVAQLILEHQAVMREGGREFDTDQTNTQGLKIADEKVLPL